MASLALFQVRKSNMQRTLSAAGLALTMLMAAPNAFAGAWTIEHVTVVDGTGAPPRRDMTVVVDGDRITDVTPSNAVAAPT